MLVRPPALTNVSLLPGEILYAPNLVHHHRNVIVHVVVDVPHEQRSGDAYRPKGETRIIDGAVCVRVRFLPRDHHQLVCGLIAGYARNAAQSGEEADGGELDGGLDGFRVE